MKIKTILINLALSACVATLLSYAFSIFIFDLTTYTLSAILLTIFCAVLYPFCSRLTQTDIGFVKGMLILPLILTFAVGFSEVVYYRKMEAIHHDFSECMVVLVICWLNLVCIAISFYTVGYFSSKWFLKRWCV
jgi:hypothetical protein